MSLTCALSQEVPSDPVLSPVSGSIYERRLIEKYLDDNGTDPVSGEPLDKEQLLEVKVPPFVRPRVPTATSIPALIKLFQDEWDATMLETFKLRKHVHSIRQELTHSLYQHDAACRVIARLTRERDEARNALATMQPGPAPEPAAAAEPASGSMETEDDDGMSAEVLAKLQKTAKTLSKGRKKRSKPQGLKTAAEMQSLSQSGTHSGLCKASAGITALSLGSPEDSLVLTGSSDKTAALYDVDNQKIVATLTGHKKKVTDVVLHPGAGTDTAITSSADKTVLIWKASTGQSTATVKTHSADVTGLSLHPTGDYFLTSSDDRHWGFHSIETGQTLAYLTDEQVTGGLSCVQVHPDGMIFAAGSTSNTVHIWDLKEQKIMANFVGHTGKITAASFSENGYYLATASADATVKLWDLRKVTDIHTIEMEAGNKVNTVAFDHSGSFLAIGGNDVRVYASKTWEHLKTMEDHSKPVMAVGFGPLAKNLYSGSMDRTLKVYT